MQWNCYHFYKTWIYISSQLSTVNVINSLLFQKSPPNPSLVWILTIWNVLHSFIQVLEIQWWARPVYAFWDWDRDFLILVSKFETETETFHNGINLWDWDWDFHPLVSNFETETETFELSIKFWDWDWDFGTLVSMFETETETS